MPSVALGTMRYRITRGLPEGRVYHVGDEHEFCPDESDDRLTGTIREVERADSDGRRRVLTIETP